MNCSEDKFKKQIMEAQERRKSHATSHFICSVDFDVEHIDELANVVRSTDKIHVDDKGEVIILFNNVSDEDFESIKNRLESKGINIELRGNLL